MNFLFYLELHPIRSSHLTFIHVLHKISGLVGNHDDFSMHVLCSRHIYRIACCLYPSLIPFFIQPTVIEQENIDCLLDKNWMESGRFDWASLMSGDHNPKYKIYADVLGSILDHRTVDVVCHWGTNRTIRTICDAKNIPIISHELGCVRSPYFESIAMDRVGVNGDALVVTQGVTVTDNSVYDKKYVCKASEVDPMVDFNINKNNIYTNVDVVFERLGLKNNTSFIYIPLQLEDDANFLLFSDFVDNIAFVKQVQSTVKNKLLVVKAHPGMSQKRHRKAYREMVLYCEQQNIIFLGFDSKLSSLDLLTACQQVVTINSSVGFEALLLDRDVTVYGQACYKINEHKTYFEAIDKSNCDVGLNTIKNNVIKQLMHSYLHHSNVLMLPSDYFRVVRAVLNDQKIELKSNNSMCAPPYWKKVCAEIVKRISDVFV